MSPPLVLRARCGNYVRKPHHGVGKHRNPRAAARSPALPPPNTIIAEKKSVSTVGKTEPKDAVTTELNKFDICLPAKSYGK
jgi:hypothetical protein